MTSKKAIDKVVFNGDYLVMDKVKFDTSQPKVIKGKKRPNHGCVAMVMATAMALQEAPKPRAPRVYGGF